MRGLIICSEKEEGLRSLTQGRSLATLPLANGSLLDYQLSFFAKAGIRELVVVAPKGKGRELEEILGRWGGLKYSLVNPQETSVFAQGELLLDSTLIVLMGPLITAIDLCQALSFHQERESGATLFLHSVSRERHRYLIFTDGLGRVIKVLPGAPVAGEMAQAAGSLYILEPTAARQLIPRLMTGREEGVCPGLLKMAIPVYGFPVVGYWQEVRNPTAYFRVHRDILSGRAGLKPAGVEESPGIWLGQGVEVRAGVELVPPVVLGAGVQLGAGVRVQGSVLGPGTQVDGETVVEDSLLLANCYLGRGVVVQGAIVGEDTIVAGGSILRPGMLLAPQSVVSRDSLLGRAFEFPLL
ncbi:MAG: NDP-sugar synthase [Firmicutes bacterium]|nr:NDP-sugar synthase [Bacillota bacterium]